MLMMPLVHFFLLLYLHLARFHAFSILARHAFLNSLTVIVNFVEELGSILFRATAFAQIIGAAPWDTVFGLFYEILCIVGKADRPWRQDMFQTLMGIIV
jgi:hypothetical protein